MINAIRNHFADKWFVYFMGAVGAMFVLALLGMAERSRKINALCYSQGMVVVNTDAGKYCADPRAMIQIKQ